MALYEIIYVSVAPGDMAAAELSSLMDRAREHNARRGITGMLLYHNREFMQLLEGEEAEVKALYETICGDHRHQQVYKMWEGPIAERNFPAGPWVSWRPTRRCCAAGPATSHCWSRG